LCLSATLGNLNNLVTRSQSTNPPMDLPASPPRLEPYSRAYRVVWQRQGTYGHSKFLSPPPQSCDAFCSKESSSRYVPSGGGCKCKQKRKKEKGKTTFAPSRNQINKPGTHTTHTQQNKLPKAFFLTHDNTVASVRVSTLTTSTYIT